MEESYVFGVFFTVLYVKNRYLLDYFSFFSCYIQGQEEENAEFRQMFIYTFGEREKKLKIAVLS